MNFKKRIEQLAVELTQHRSVTETIEEQRIATYVYDFFSEMSYFKKNPEKLFYVPVEHDPWGRKSVIAILRGQKKPSEKAVILIGHTDTVGISDYGELKEMAHMPYLLTEQFKKIKNVLPNAVREDLESGDYLFGRGLFDMKTGDAINMALMEDIEKNLDQFEGTLVFAAVCDEESNSKGMLSCVPEFLRLKNEYNLDYQALIDTDYMTEEFPGDSKKYVYVGTVGKLMPTFFAVGKETHVGESFGGLDPNQLLSELVTRINMNTDFCDEVEGEVTLPPMSLKLRDLKPEYSVQTAKTAHLFFNYATHASTPDEVLEKMSREAECAFDKVIQRMNHSYQTYNQMTDRKVPNLPWKTNVLTYQQLYTFVEEEIGDRLTEELDALTNKLQEDSSVDEREFSLKVVEKVHQLWSNPDPVIIVYFTPPYYPHIYVEGASEKERKLLDSVKQAVKSTETTYQVVQKKFFPYISDLSYAAAPSEEGALSSLSQNMPGFGTRYILPLKEMQTLNLPVVNIGPFGKDAHQYTERVEKNYSFEVTPQLVRKTISHLLKE